MKLSPLVLAVGLGSSMAGGCSLDNDTRAPDPGLYWGWACPDGGPTVPASAPLDYVASGSCGAGGPFTVGVDGCAMSGSWSALGLSNVATAEYTSTPGNGGWGVSATGGVADGGAEDAGADGGGASWNCTATAAAGGQLTFSCSDATTSAATCRSTLTPVSGS